MKRSITLLLALLVLLSFTIGVANAAPPANSAARQAQLNAIRPNELLKYYAYFPENGTKVTEKDYKALLDKYPNKDKSKGDTRFTYELITSGGEYGDYMIKLKTWEKAATKNSFPALYQECVYSVYPWAMAGWDWSSNAWEYMSNGASRGFNTKDIICRLETEDKTYRYQYYWLKGSKTGVFEKHEKEEEYRRDLVSEYQFYKDETVLGELCKVYVIDLGYWEDYGEGREFIDYVSNYYWLSTVTGKTIKTSAYGEEHEEAHTYYIDYRLNKPASFYTPPKDVKFTELIPD